MMIILGILVIVVLICLGIYAREDEKKRYNNGFCPNCGNSLRCFDMDSQGGRMYKCDTCGYYTSVTYSIDKTTDICKACMFDAPHEYCCKIECGEHDFCRHCTSKAKSRQYYPCNYKAGEQE